MIYAIPLHTHILMYCFVILLNPNRDYLPLRWFVFGKDSFDENGETLIEVRDPHLENTPGYHYGWHAYYGVPVFYGFKLDAAPSGVYTTEMLTSNAVYQTSSP